jgi:hypothetical protein
MIRIGILPLVYTGVSTPSEHLECRFEIAASFAGRVSLRSDTALTHAPEPVTRYLPARIPNILHSYRRFPSSRFEIGRSLSFFGGIEIRYT